MDTKCNCGNKLDFISCWDDGENYAHNTYDCDHCGDVFVERVWSNKGITTIHKDGTIDTRKQEEQND